VPRSDKLDRRLTKQYEGGQSIGAAATRSLGQRHQFSAAPRALAHRPSDSENPFPA
jgi:hypothetical protein